MRLCASRPLGGVVVKIDVREGRQWLQHNLAIGIDLDAPLLRAEGLDYRRPLCHAIPGNAHIRQQQSHTGRAAAFTSLQPDFGQPARRCP